MVSEIEVTVTRLRIRMLHIVYGGGYQIVVGGRLVLDNRDGRDIPHPELPEYIPGMFPTDFTNWSDSEDQGVKVRIVGRKGKERDAEAVRACTLLFTPMPADAVREWIRSRQ